MSFNSPVYPYLPDEHIEQSKLAYRIWENAFQTRVSEIQQKLSKRRHENEDNESQTVIYQSKSKMMRNELSRLLASIQNAQVENAQLSHVLNDCLKRQQSLEGITKAVKTNLQVSLDPIETRYETQKPQLVKPNYERLVESKESKESKDSTRQSSRKALLERSRGSQDVQKRQSSSVTSSMSFDLQIVDGSTFFRAAKASLSYDQFNSFMRSMKMYSKKRITKEVCLEEVERVFLPEHRELNDILKKILLGEM